MAEDNTKHSGRCLPDATLLFGGRSVLARNIVALIRKNDIDGELINTESVSTSDESLLGTIDKDQLLRLLFISDATISDAFPSPDWNDGDPSTSKEAWKKEMRDSECSLIGIDGTDAPEDLMLTLYLQDRALNQLCAAPKELSDDENEYFDSERREYLKLSQAADDIAG